MSSGGLNAGMETSELLVKSIVNNTFPLHLTHLSDATSYHSPSALLSGELVAQDFVVSWTDVRAVRLS